MSYKLSKNQMIIADSGSTKTTWRISNKEQKGIYNLTSPSPTTNSQFTKALSRTLKRPDFFTVPSFLIKMVFGEMGDKLLLNGSAVYPKKLLDNGYEFKFKTIESALKNITDK